MTESATAIGAGNLDQLVAIDSDDELGQLSKAFNDMARQLRHYRQSHQAQLLRAQQTSQATIDSFPEPVLVVDPEQVVEMANPAARALLGVRPREEGQAVATAWQPPEALRQPLMDALRKQVDYLPEGFHRAIVIQRGDQPRFYLPRILPIRDPQSATVGAAVLLEDITRFHLLDEVKSNLVATVSHELKTPLTSLRLVLHLLLEETIGPLAPKQLELLVDARDNAERMLKIINNLLDLTRLEHGGSLLHKKPCSPEDLIKMAAESIQLRAKDKGVELVVRECLTLPPIPADVDRLQHAFHNLLNNSLAHTPQGGRITLAAEAGQESVVFSVADTGTGIPPEHVEHIFEKYYRVPGDSAPGGSGLGLAIVREIAVAHGGSVSCESVVGQRTVFRMTLPIQ
jgi:signal transduction histidine kinase